MIRCDQTMCSENHRRFNFQYVSKKTSFTFQCRIKSSLHYSLWTLAEEDAASRQESLLRRTKRGLLSSGPSATRRQPPLGKGSVPGHRPLPPPVPKTDAHDRWGPKPARQRARVRAPAAGARVAASKIRHRSSVQR